MNIMHLPLIGLGVLVASVATFVLWPEHVDPKTGQALPRGEPVKWDILISTGDTLDGVRTAHKATPSAHKVGAWPNLLGPGWQNIAPDDGVPLAKSWPAGGPPILWEREVGNGHAGVAIYDGVVYLTDYDPDLFIEDVIDEKTGKPALNAAGEPLRAPVGGDVIRAMSLDTGENIWTYSYKINTVNNHGVSRPVPAVNAKYLVSIGPKLQVFCLDRVTGEKKWAFDMVGKYGSMVPRWYAGQCPLIDGDFVVLAPSGKAGAGVESKEDVLMVKMDLETGEIVWSADNTLRSDQTHVSLATMDLYGTKTYVYSGSQGMTGVHAETGEVLWDSKKWFNKIANCATPVPLPDHRLFLSAGYGSGSMMVRLEQTATGFEMVELWSKPEKEFGSVQHTPIYDAEHDVIYGIRVNGEMICMQLDGTMLWTSGKEKINQYGIGPYLMSQQGLLYALDGHGRLDVIEARPDKFSKLGSHQVLKNKDAWGPMALAGGRLIARDIKRLICVDVSEPGQ